jgi:hypothetical protein
VLIAESGDILGYSRTNHVTWTRRRTPLPLSRSQVTASSVFILLTEGSTFEIFSGICRLGNGSNRTITKTYSRRVVAIVANTNKCLLLLPHSFDTFDDSHGWAAPIALARANPLRLLLAYHDPLNENIVEREPPVRMSLKNSFLGSKPVAQSVPSSHLSNDGLGGSLQLHEPSCHKSRGPPNFWILILA